MKDSSKAFFLFANRFPSAHAVLRPHDSMRESSQWNCGEDYFITLHVGRWQIHCSPRPTSLWARVPAVSTLRKHTSLPGYIFLPLLQTLDATVTIRTLSPPPQALLSLSFSPFQSPLPPSQGEDEAVSAQLGSMQLLL